MADFWRKFWKLGDYFVSFYLVRCGAACDGHRVIASAM